MSVQTSTASRGAARVAAVLALLALAGTAAAAIRPPGATVLAPPKAAAERLGADDLRALQGRPISMDEAIDMAQRRFNARVVRAEVSERDGRRVYLLRLLSDDGRVFNVRVDAATGSMQ